MRTRAGLLAVLAAAIMFAPACRQAPQSTSPAPPAATDQLDAIETTLARIERDLTGEG